jgi:hypothetical protein
MLVWARCASRDRHVLVRFSDLELESLKVSVR